MQQTQTISGSRAAVVAGLGGGSGKSVVAVGLVAAFRGRGLRVAPFKKGPDYIDAGWLQLAAHSPCYNLDPYLMTDQVIHGSFLQRIQDADRVIIEGNRGLYDGVDPEGAFSTAELAVKLGLPVLLVVDCTKTTRTVAALVLGCRELDPRVTIGGVVLNRVGTSRHEDIVRQAVEKYTGLPVVGAFPRRKQDIFPQRHLGVTPHQEHEEAEQVIERLAAIAEKYLDMESVEKIMSPVGEAGPGKTATAPAASVGGKPVRIGLLRDAAFQFYYPENLEALEREGAELVEINALEAGELPEGLSALYIGGGFPETAAGRLSANRSFLDSVRERIGSGLPVYAECGGLIYLGRSMVVAGEEYPLAGIFPVRFGLERKPQAHGYTILKVSGGNPYYPEGLTIKGHEFRYSRILEWSGNPAALVLEMERGTGFAGGRDGLVTNNVLALYTHVHAEATPEWAPALVGRARQWRLERDGA